MIISDTSVHRSDTIQTGCTTHSSMKLRRTDIAMKMMMIIIILIIAIITIIRPIFIIINGWREGNETIPGPCRSYSVFPGDEVASIFTSTPSTCSNQMTNTSCRLFISFSFSFTFTSLSATASVSTSVSLSLPLFHSQSLCLQALW
jgi:hypothetical protein